MKDRTPRWHFLDQPVSARDIGDRLQVIHDVNPTAMFADRLALIGAGRILAQGTPRPVLCDDLPSRAHGCALRVNTAPAQGTFILPHAARMAAE